MPDKKLKGAALIFCPALKKCILLSEPFNPLRWACALLLALIFIALHREILALLYFM